MSNIDRAGNFDGYRPPKVDTIAVYTNTTNRISSSDELYAIIDALGWTSDAIV